MPDITITLLIQWDTNTDEVWGGEPKQRHHRNWEGRAGGGHIGEDNRHRVPTFSFSSMSNSRTFRWISTTPNWPIWQTQTRQGPRAKLRPCRVTSVDRTERRGMTFSRTSNHFLNKGLLSTDTDLMSEILEKSRDQQSGYNSTCGHSCWQWPTAIRTLRRKVRGFLWEPQGKASYDGKTAFHIHWCPNCGERGPFWSGPWLTS